MQRPRRTATTVSYVPPPGDGLRTRSCIDVVSDITALRRAAAASRMTIRYRPSDPSPNTAASALRTSPKSRAMKAIASHHVIRLPSRSAVLALLDRSVGVGHS